MAYLSFSVSPEDRDLINKISIRAVSSGIHTDRIDCIMDLSCAQANGANMDFERLLSFDDFNFSHDISGVNRCLDHDTGKLMHNFLPRCCRN